MTFTSAPLHVSEEDVIRFAGEFDPQPFHTDPQAARSSFFGGHVASGWHTAALTMKLLVSSGIGIAGGLVGAGGELKWPAALRPGDDIHLEIEVVGTRPLGSRADMGMLTTRTRTLNQDGVVVQELVARLFVPRKSPASG